MNKITSSRCYEYGCFMKFWSWLGVIGSIVLLISGLFFVFTAFYVQAVREKQFILFLTLFSTAYAIISIVGFILMSNLTPDICIDEEYLYVSFFFMQKRARLDDIVKIKRVLVPARKQSFVILFREGLTPFHRLYGWVYGRSFYPGIYVRGSISDKDELENLLRRYARLELE